MDTDDRILCPGCKINVISVSRNKRRLCKNCADKTRYLSSKFSNVQPFTFQSGCKEAMPTLKAEQALNAAALIDSSPIHLSLCSKGNTMQTYAMIHNSNLAALKSAIGFKNDGSNSYTTTQCRLTLHEPDDQNVQKSALKDPVANILAESHYPRIEAVFGEFIEMDKDLAAQLNTDFRIFPQWLQSVANLHAGCLIHNNSITVFIVTAEVYSKHSSTDIHAESSGLSSPYTNNRYPGIFTGIVPDSDGKKMKHKFILASNTMNLLFTCSIILSDKDNAQIGPGVSIPTAAIDCKTTQIYYRKSAVEQFKHTTSEPNINTTATSDMTNAKTVSSSLNISRQRQLLSGFHHRSTYELYRASAPGFEDQLHMPVTVFTLCDVPHFDGYGVGEKASATIASRILQIIAIAHHRRKGVIHLEDFEDLLSVCQTLLETKKDTKCWTAIRKSIEVIQAKTDHGKSATSLVQLCADTTFNELAQEAASKCSIANEKIMKNVLGKFKKMCC